LAANDCLNMPGNVLEGKPPKTRNHDPNNSKLAISNPQSLWVDSR
jgi:hypothetical protein